MLSVFAAGIGFFLWFGAEKINRPFTSLPFAHDPGDPADMTSYSSRSAYEFTESPKATPVRPEKPATPVPAIAEESTTTPSKTSAFSCTHFQCLVLPRSLDDSFTDTYLPYPYLQPFCPTNGVLSPPKPPRLQFAHEAVFTTMWPPTPPQR